MRSSSSDGSRSSFSTKEVAELANITPRQVRSWADDGLVPPSVDPGSGKGSRKLFSYQDLLAFRTMSRLEEDGMTHQAVKAVVEKLRNELGKNVIGVRLHVVGESVISIEDNGHLNEVMNLQARSNTGTQGVLDLGKIVEIDDLRDDLDNKIVNLRPPRSAKSKHRQSTPSSRLVESTGS